MQVGEYYTRIGHIRHGVYRITYIGPNHVALKMMSPNDSVSLALIDIHNFRDTYRKSLNSEIVLFTRHITSSESDNTST